MTKYSVHIGINDYPGSGADLNGCVNDTLGWKALAEGQDYEPTVLLNSDATKLNVTDLLTEVVSKARYRDTILVTYSGHGSWVPDIDGDETDGRDECLVLYDYANRGIITDDEMHRIFQQRKHGIRPIIIPDSCHSGSVLRFAGPILGASKPRYFAPSQFLEGQELELAKHAQHLPRRTFTSRPTTAMIAGCDDSEFSYDAFIEGRFQGAFSHYALRTWEPGINLKNWHAAIRQHLPKDQYPQSPQASLTYTQRRWTL